MDKPWKEQDGRGFTKRQWDLDEAERQHAQLTKGGVPVDATTPCIHGDGIHMLNDEEKRLATIAFSELLTSNKKLTRFVPASGAASRMFAPLRGDLSPEVVETLAVNGHRLPMLNTEAHASLNPMDRAQAIATELLAPNPGWSKLPKGLIPFHRYPNGDVRTPFEEHAAEWQDLAPGQRIHFTVPEPHLNSIRILLENKGFDAIDFSIQSSETDTLALDLESKELARDAQGQLLFRPGGHGALLHNMNAISDDFVFIRNIDNVVPQHRMAARNEAQRLLGGEAYRLTQERNALVMSLRQEELGSMERAIAWLRGFSKDERVHSREQLLDALNRPIRVAGMVPNEGDAGGGPFWIRLKGGAVVPAIVEGAELKSGMLGKGTHFNPVDICCSLTGQDGLAYDLNQFAAHELFFTAEKDWNGRPIRILERPGLWNGAMAHWLTRFIEVSGDTFAPVKSVLDLMDINRWK
tara:strand:- start:3790 stop:5187 length:1398 start_codon:yes stop_codon:yes gene_type:complete